MSEAIAGYLLPAPTSRQGRGPRSRCRRYENVRSRVKSCRKMVWESADAGTDWLWGLHPKLASFLEFREERLLRIAQAP